MEGANEGGKGTYKAARMLRAFQSRLSKVHFVNRLPQGAHAVGMVQGPLVCA